MQKKKGFTIIEVVLVLAIAGLIFLMVFVALPTLQASQRDTQRKNYLSTVSAALVSYISNNNSLPSGTDKDVSVTTDTSASNYATSGKGWKGFAYGYLLGNGTEEVVAQSELYYKLKVTELASGKTSIEHAASSAAIDTLYIDLGVSCGANDGSKITNTKESNDGTRSFAISTRLENGGFYCVEN